MKCITDNLAVAKTAISQIGVGFVLLLVSLSTKWLILFGIGVIVTGLGIRGIVKICRDK